MMLEEISKIIEDALLAEDSVADLFVTRDDNEFGAKTLMVFVSLTRPDSAQRLHNILVEMIDEDNIHMSVVAVSRIPRLNDGTVDRQQLMNLLTVQDQRTITQAQNSNESSFNEFLAAPNRPGFSVSVLLGENQLTNSCSEQATSLDILQTSNSALSYLDGGTLMRDPAGPRTLQEALERAAVQAPEKGVLFVNGFTGKETILAYGTLLERAKRFAGGLASEGLVPGSHVLILIKKTEDFVLAFWGCILAGVVPVPCEVPLTFSESNNSLTKLIDVWKLLQSPPIITEQVTEKDLYEQESEHFHDAHILIVEEIIKEHNQIVNVNVVPTDTALMLLTSGSTSVPKLVVQTHEALLTYCESATQANGLCQNDVSLNWLPFDHVGGLVMFHLRDVWLHCNQVHAAISDVIQEPLRWLNWIDKYQVTVTWAPNFAFGLINNLESEFKNNSWNLSSLKCLINGGELIVVSTTQEFLHLLEPHGLAFNAMRPAWGMSETCSGVVYSPSFRTIASTNTDRYVSVGVPVPGFKIRVVNDLNEIVSQGTIGSLEVQGPSVTKEYFRNSTANADAFTDDGWFRTGDKAIVVDGQMAIVGREKSVIIINGLNFSSVEIEAIVETVEGVKPSYTAAFEVRHMGDPTGRLVILFVPQNKGSNNELIAKIRHKIILNFHIPPFIVLAVDELDIPKTSIGKIQRSKLKELFEEGKFGNQRITRGEDRRPELIPEWFARLSWCKKQAEQLLPRIVNGGTVVISGGEFGAGLVTLLRERGYQTHHVVQGDRVEPVDNVGWRCNLDSSAQWSRLFEQLEASKINRLVIPCFIDNETLEYAQADPNPIKALSIIAAVIKGLMRTEHCERIELIAITRGAHAFMNSDQPPLLSQAGIASWLKSAQMELPWLHVKQIDLSQNSAPDLESLVTEFGKMDRDSDIALRTEGRFTPMIQGINIAQDTVLQGCVIEPGGLYLISGGLGGVGFEVSKWLIENFCARLLIIGRTPLPTEVLVDSPEYSERVNQRLQRLNILKHTGDVCYLAVDATDDKQLFLARDFAEKQFGTPLRGVFHLSCELGQGYVNELDWDEFEEVLSSKALSAVSLTKLMDDRKQGVLVFFSSVCGFFGGVGLSAYAAANDFLDHFAERLRRTSLHSVYSIAWSMWRDTGLSKSHSNPELVKMLGFDVMSPSEALISLEAILKRKPSNWFVGVNRRVPNLSWQSTDPLWSWNRTEMSVLHKSNTGIVQTRSNEEHLDMVPKNIHKKCDQINRSENNSREEIQYPERTSLKSTMLEVRNIWCKLLELSDVAPTENFFDLGGHSLIVPRVQSALQKRFEIELKAVDLFRYPTLESLSAYVNTLIEKKISGRMIDLQTHASTHG